MSPTRAQLLTLATRVTEAYNTWSLPALLAFRAPHCLHHYPPGSVKQGPFTNAQYEAYFSAQIPLFTDFALTVRDTAVDVEGRKVWMHVTSTATTPIGPYANEYVIMLQATADGELVEKFVEFVDSWTSVKFFGKMERYLAEERRKKKKKEKEGKL